MRFFGFTFGGDGRDLGCLLAFGAASAFGGGEEASAAGADSGSGAGSGSGADSSAASPCVSGAGADDDSAGGAGFGSGAGADDDWAAGAGFGSGAGADDDWAAGAGFGSGEGADDDWAAGAGLGAGFGADASCFAATGAGPEADLLFAAGFIPSASALRTRAKVIISAMPSPRIAAARRWPTISPTGWTAMKKPPAATSPPNAPLTSARPRRRLGTKKLRQTPTTQPSTTHTARRSASGAHMDSMTTLNGPQSTESASVPPMATSAGAYDRP